MRLISLWTLLALPLAAIAQDTVRVRADNPPVWGTNVRLERTLTVGVTDGPREYAFGDIEFFALRPDGRFYIYDSKDKQIRMYDAVGKFLVKIGRLGDGPGEYRSLQGMAVVDDTILAAWDPRNRRMSYFGPSGRLIASWVLPKAPSSFGSSPFGIDAFGVHYIRGTDIKRRKVSGTFAQIYVRYSRTGELIDPIRIPDENAGSGDLGGRNFHERTVTARYTGGAIVTGRNDRYAIAFRPAPSAQPMLVERSHSRVQVTPDEAREWDALAHWVERNQPPPHPQIITERFEARPTPRTKPVFRSLYADDDGRIWVQLHVAAVKGENTNKRGTPLTWHAPSVYDVIGSTGTFLGRVQLPAGSDLMAARGNVLWLRGLGTDDEPIMTRYTIVGAR